MSRARMRPLGALEERTMELLWRRDGLLAVRDVNRALGGKLAHTTVMTTLDRLFKKGLLERQKEGTAYLYRARIDRDEYHRRVVESAMSGLLAKSAEPVMAGFIDAALAIDRDNLGRLEALLARRRRGGRR